MKTLDDRSTHDPHYNQVIKLYSGPVERRSFANWSMGYKTLSVSELNQLWHTPPLSTLSSPPKPTVILSVMKVLYANNHRN